MSSEKIRFSVDSQGNVEDNRLPALMRKLEETLGSIPEEDNEEYWRELREKFAAWTFDDLVFLNTADVQVKLERFAHAERIKDTLTIVSRFKARHGV